MSSPSYMFTDSQGRPTYTELLSRCRSILYLQRPGNSTAQEIAEEVQELSQEARTIWTLLSDDEKLHLCYNVWTEPRIRSSIQRVPEVFASVQEYTNLHVPREHMDDPEAMFIAMTLDS